MDLSSPWHEACREAGVSDERAHAFLREMEQARVDELCFEETRAMKCVEADLFRDDQQDIRQELAEFDELNIGGVAATVARDRLELSDLETAYGLDVEYELRAAATDIGYITAANAAHAHMRAFKEELERHHARQHLHAPAGHRGSATPADERALDRLGLSSWHVPPGYTGPSAACRRRHHRAHQVLPDYHLSTAYATACAAVEDRFIEVEAMRAAQYERCSGRYADENTRFLKHHQNNPHSPYFVPPSEYGVPSTVHARSHT